MLRIRNPSRYEKPYVARAELMVQLLVSVIARDRSKRAPADDRRVLANSIRATKSMEAFLLMADSFEQCVAWGLHGVGI